ncbi:hypothetical protein [Nitriliruptor alkaliphilus]|uniref:hypothetical protein n=1 Tax=Nitriliruptor alkaliphilus TaxID=427918 RepID=UPI0006977FC7|nr:hypothetical protein [Nitriliruptor alkaliphilus]
MIARNVGAARRGLAVLGVALLGVVGGHELGYLVGGAADGGLATPHTHLAAATRVAHLFAVWFLLAAAVSDPRRGWTRGLTVPRLAILQSGLYVTLEVAERVAQGTPLAELTSRCVLFGLLLQLPLAATTVLLSRVTQTAVERLLAGGPALLVVPTGRPRCTRGPEVAPRSRRPLAATSRGPPVGPLLVAA